MTVTAAAYDPAMGVAWNPWHALRGRPHLRLVWAHLPAGCDGRLEDDGHERRVVLDFELERRVRRGVLAHELIHDERNILYPPETPSAIVEKEEAYVDREVARRLVPMTLLARFVDRVAEVGEPVHAASVAEEFDVSLDVAQRALWLLEQGRTA